MKRKIIRISLILLVWTLVFITSFNIILKDKYENTNYFEFEFKEVKEEADFKEIYFTFKNKSDYYMRIDDFEISFKDYYYLVDEPIVLKPVEEYYKYEQDSMKMYISPRDEEVYFVKIPKDIKFTEGTSGWPIIRYSFETRLFLSGRNQNSLYKEILMFSNTGRVEVDPKLLNN